MAWSPQLTKLFIQGDIPQLQAYIERLGSEIDHNSHRPKRAARLRELTVSAGCMVEAIQEEALRMTAEDEPTSPLLGVFARR